MTLFPIESSPARSDTTVLYLLRSRHQYRQRHRREINVVNASPSRADPIRSPVPSFVLISPMARLAKGRLSLVTCAPLPFRITDDFLRVTTQYSAGRTPYRAVNGAFAIGVHHIPNDPAERPWQGNPNLATARRLCPDRKFYEPADRQQSRVGGCPGAAKGLLPGWSAPVGYGQGAGAG
jgi:hypothetical protein